MTRVAYISWPDPKHQKRTEPFMHQVAPYLPLLFQSALKDKPHITFPNQIQRAAKPTSSTEILSFLALSQNS